MNTAEYATKEEVHELKEQLGGVLAAVHKSEAMMTSSISEIKSLLQKKN